MAELKRKTRVGLSVSARTSLRRVGGVPDRRRLDRGAGLAQLGRGFPPAREVDDRFLTIVLARKGQVDADSRVEVGRPRQVRLRGLSTITRVAGDRPAGAMTLSSTQTRTWLPSKRKTGPGPASTLVCMSRSSPATGAFDRALSNQIDGCPGPIVQSRSTISTGPSARIPV